jgi:hypothetical protein
LTCARRFRAWPWLACLPVALWAGCAAPAPTAEFICGQPASTERAAESPRIAQLRAEADRAVADVVRCLGLTEPSAQATVHLFGSRGALRAFLKERCPRQADSPAACFETAEGYVLALCDQGDDKTRARLRHEVTHYVLAAHFCDIPPWADEGLAQYFELGPPPGADPERMSLLTSSLAGASPGMLSRLVSVPAGARLTRREYAESWALVSFLMSRSDGPAALRRYLEQVRAGAGPHRQFRAAFLRSAEEMEADFRASVRLRDRK